MSPIPNKARNTPDAGRGTAAKDRNSTTFRVSVTSKGARSERFVMVLVWG